MPIYYSRRISIYTMFKLLVLISLAIFVIENNGDNFSHVEPLPTFLRSNNGDFMLIPSPMDGKTYLSSKSMSYIVSVQYNENLCYIKDNGKEFQEFTKIWTNITVNSQFKCLVLEKGRSLLSMSNLQWTKDATLFVNLLSMCYKPPFKVNFVKRYSILEKILKLTWTLKLNSVVQSEVWKVMLMNNKEFLKESRVIKAMKTNHLNLMIIRVKKTKFVKIEMNIQILLSSKISQTVLIGNFKTSKLLNSKYDSFRFMNFIMVLQKEPIDKELFYNVKFHVSNSYQTYECYKRELWNQNWNKGLCLTKVTRTYGGTYVECNCTNEGFVAVSQEKRLKDFQNTVPDKLQDYWGFYYPWDFADDRTKYLKEDEMRYLPFIAVMRLIVVGFAALNLLVYIYLGFVLCLKKKRIFYALETISVIIFLTCLSISNLGFHIMAYVGLVWIRNNIGSWCSFVSFFHLNYVMSLCAFQCYVFIVSITKHSKWLHNIALPILLLASPVTAGVLDGTATVWINKGCNFRVFNLSQNITLLLIVLPCLVSTVLLPVMAVCTYAIIRKVGRLYGFMATFLFSAMHLLGGIFLWLANTGENTELQFYFQFCIVAIIETVYQSLLAVFLLILSNNNISMMDRHCTHDLDTKVLHKYFEDPKSAIQLRGRM